MVGYPIELLKDKYERKCIEFNLGILIDAGEYQERESVYSVLLRKAGKVLIDLEEECEFVWSEKYKEQIARFIRAIYEDLQQNLWTHCQITDCTALHAKLRPFESSPKLSETLNDYDVPILMNEIDGEAVKDLGVRYVMEQIDGIKCIQQLTANVDISIVKNAIRYLQKLQCVALVDIFQYGNCYALKDLKALIDSTEMQRECMEYAEIRDDTEDPVELFKELATSPSVEDFIYSHEELKVDIRRLVAFGVVNKIIRRIQFHVYIKEGPKREELARKLIELSDVAFKYGIKFDSVKQMLNGSICLDAMALKLRIPPQEIKKVAIRFNASIFPK
eukprot:TRINITY_DN4247_c0_g3_i3.p1 TRINITY_DN4247_c0_g3~~TRINITY_DN4247_c0_g3_i3.p1  ORF type:complete len:333 (+),score=67.81 TRINITY_DN4247_c0_g3_i3:1398-2396(+)